jgi:hypothetical protein
VENIERIARTVYFSTKIEYELEQAGITLFAADEGIAPAEVHNLSNGSAPGRKATPTLTRRVKQAIAEWYSLNMKELAWGGFKEHTNQGFNIGKPPYGYIADRIKHPVKAKAHDGRFKHRLIPDDVRGTTVAQIFLWRALDTLCRMERVYDSDVAVGVRLRRSWGSGRARPGRHANRRPGSQWRAACGWWPVLDFPGTGPWSGAFL